MVFANEHLVIEDRHSLLIVAGACITLSRIRVLAVTNIARIFCCNDATTSIWRRLRKPPRVRTARLIWALVPCKQGLALACGALLRFLTVVYR